MQEIKKINLSLEKIKTVTLADVSINNKGEYGIGASAVDYSDELYTYLRITDINDDGTLNKNDLKSVDDVDAKNYLLNENDVVFARTGNSTGKAYYYDKMDGELVYAGFLIKFSLDSSKINPKFMKYYVLSKDYKGWVNSMCTGSTRPNINAKMYGNMELILPPREQQDFLVNILGEIDNKIEINKRINKNLEEQLETLYNSFFVYYDDFLKEDLEECEIGLIPKEWSLLSLGDVTTKINEKVGSNDYKVFSAVNTGNLILSEEYFDKQVYSKSIEKYIVVKQKEFAYNPARINIGSIGRNDFGFDGCVSPVYVAFKVEEGYENFMNMYIKSNRFNQWVITLSSGSVRQTLNYNDFSIIKIAYPPKELINKFNTIYDSYYEVINYNKSVINNLEKIRDLLLPKLMSGEIDVSQINCDLELKYNYMKYLFNQIHTPMSKSVV